MSDDEDLAREQAFWRSARQLPAILGRCGVGEAYQRARIADSPVGDKVWRRLQRFAAGFEPPDGLVLQGLPGRGKTHLAVGCMRPWVLRGYSATFITATELMATMRDAFETGERAAYHAFARPDLLVLDDLGQEGKASEHVCTVLREVIDSRLRVRRTTIITTVLPEFETRYGESIDSRLKLFARFVLDGPDRRGL